MSNTQTQTTTTKTLATFTDRNFFAALFKQEHSTANAASVAKLMRCDTKLAYARLTDLAMRDVIAFDADSLTFSTLRTRDEISEKTALAAFDALDTAATSKATRSTAKRSESTHSATQSTMSNTAAQSTRVQSERSTLTLDQRVVYCKREHAAKARHARELCKACYRSARLAKLLKSDETSATVQRDTTEHQQAARISKTQSATKTAASKRAA